MAAAMIDANNSSIVDEDNQDSDGQKADETNDDSMVGITDAEEPKESNSINKKSGGQNKKKTTSFNPGDLVFAKVKGYPFWPARVESGPPAGMKMGRDKIPVFFFGTYEAAICSVKELIAYNEKNVAKHASKNKQKKFRIGMKEIQETPDITCQPSSVLVTKGSSGVTSTTISNEPFSPAAYTDSVVSGVSKTSSVKRPPSRLSHAASSSLDHDSIHADDPDVSDDKKLTIADDDDEHEVKSESKNQKKKRDHNASGSSKSKKKQKTSSESEVLKVEAPKVDQKKSASGSKRKSSSTKVTGGNKKQKVSDTNDNVMDAGPVGDQLEIQDPSVVSQDLGASGDKKKMKDENADVNLQKVQTQDSEVPSKSSSLKKSKDHHKKSTKDSKAEKKSDKKRMAKDDGDDESIRSTKNQNESEKDKMKRIKVKIEQKEKLKEELKLAKLEKKRKERLEKLKSQPVTESLLKDIEVEIVQSLVVSKTDHARCLNAMSKLDLLQVNQSCLVSYPSILKTIKKCRKYKSDVEIRNKSNYLYNKFKMLFSNGVEEALQMQLLNNKKDISQHQQSVDTSSSSPSDATSATKSSNDEPKKHDMRSEPPTLSAAPVPGEMDVTNEPGVPIDEPLAPVVPNVTMTQSTDGPVVAPEDTPSELPDAKAEGDVNKPNDGTSGQSEPPAVTPVASDPVITVIIPEVNNTISSGDGVKTSDGNNDVTGTDVSHEST